MSFGDSGAFSASAISCAFWLTLPFRVRIVWKASLRLFWRPCLFEEPPNNALKLTKRDTLVARLAAHAIFVESRFAANRCVRRT